MKILFVFPIFNHNIGDVVDLDPIKAAPFLEGRQAIPYETKADKEAAKEFESRTIVSIDAALPLSEQEEAAKAAAAQKAGLEIPEVDDKEEPEDKSKK